MALTIREGWWQQQQIVPAPHIGPSQRLPCNSNEVTSAIDDSTGLGVHVFEGILHYAACHSDWPSVPVCMTMNDL